MLLKEAMQWSEISPQRRICRAPNRHGGFNPIRFFSKKGVLYVQDIGVLPSIRVAPFQTSPHTDWILF